MDTVELAWNFNGFTGLLDATKRRIYSGPDPEYVAKLARRHAMRFTDNDWPCGTNHDRYISGPKERDIFIPHRMPIDKSDACCRLLNID